MALASSVRLSSSILRYRLAAPLYPTRFSSLRHNLSELRFLSASSSRPGTHIRPIKARLQDDPKKEDPGEGQNGKGSVLVKDTSENSEERIVRVELHKEATEAYMAMSVLLGRALLDVRDGLKPVHCRIL